MGEKRISRRRLLAAAAGAATIALVRTVSGQSVHAAVKAPSDPTKSQGVPPGTLGTRSPFEHLVKKPSDTSARSPLQDFYGMITPSDLHFERSHAGVPRYIQPTLQQLLAARGPDMGGYHLNPIVAWRIRGDGTVLFRPENWK